MFTNIRSHHSIEMLPCLKTLPSFRFNPFFGVPTTASIIHLACRATACLVLVTALTGPVNKTTVKPAHDERASIDVAKTSYG
jgi:hypothetical protein